jgi:hydroxyethylthiazole kinase-like sugar kinase family protein
MGGRNKRQRFRNSKNCRAGIDVITKGVDSRTAFEDIVKIAKTLAYEKRVSL